MIYVSRMQKHGGNPWTQKLEEQVKFILQICLSLPYHPEVWLYYVNLALFLKGNAQYLMESFHLHLISNSPAKNTPCWNTHEA